MKTHERINELIIDWMTNPRWNGTNRPYTAEEVVTLQDANKIVSSVTKLSSEKLWHKLKTQDPVREINGFVKNDSVQGLKVDLDANLDTFEQMKSLIVSGASCVYFEDQLVSEKECAASKSKISMSSQEAINKLVAARLAADVMEVPAIIIAKTNQEKAALVNKSDKDKASSSIERGLSYAPYADLVLMETSTLNLEEARNFAEAIHAVYPNKMLAYNCSFTTLNSITKLTVKEIEVYKLALTEMGFKFQFLNFEDFYVLNKNMYKLFIA